MRKNSRLQGSGVKLAHLIILVWLSKKRATIQASVYDEQCWYFGATIFEPFPKVQPQKLQCQQIYVILSPITRYYIVII